jgi:hypothetical protein
MSGGDPATPALLKCADMASLFLALATLTRVLPALAALLSCIWYLIRIGEWAAKKLRRRPPTEPADDD